MNDIKMMRLGTLFTEPLQDHDHPDKEIGQFELPVTISETLFRRSGDKLGTVKATISHHLASAIVDTKVPSDYWVCELRDEVSVGFNLPKTFSFRTVR